MFGEDVITNDMYLTSFKLYVYRAEADIIEKVLEHKLHLDDEDFVDFLSSFDYKNFVHEANNSEILIEIAHRVSTKAELCSRLLGKSIGSSKVIFSINTQVG